MLVLVLCLAGCERLQRERRITPLIGDRVRIVVTTDGGRNLLAERDLRIKPGMTATDALEAVADVRFAPDGSVERVNGYGGGRLRALGPEPSAWFYRIDGIESGARAERFRLHPGTSLWWDLRRFDAYQSIPVAIGVFPQPLFNGYRDVVRPIRISYGTGLEFEARRFGKLLERVDPEVEPIVKTSEGRGTGIGDGAGGDDHPVPHVAVKTKRSNLVIARWEEARLDPYIADIGFDPRGFGLTVWIEGVQVRRQNPDEDLSHVLDGAVGVVWATTIDGEPDGPLVILVSGVTDEGVRMAAQALRGGALQYYLAGAVDREGAVIP